MLARAPEPLTRTRIARTLLPTGTEAQIRQLVARLGPVLTDRPAYLQQPQGRWTLGRQNMAFR